MSRTYRRDPETFKRKSAREKDKWKRGWLWLNHAPSWYRRALNTRFRAKVKDALAKDKEVPEPVKDAAYYW